MICTITVTVVITTIMLIRTRIMVVITEEAKEITEVIMETTLEDRARVAPTTGAKTTRELTNAATNGKTKRCSSSK